MAHIYMQSIIKLMNYGSRHNMSFNLALLAHDSLITRCRNSIVAAFLDTPSATHLMFIDADIAFEPEAIERLVNFDVEVAAGMYPLKVIHWPQTRQRITETASPDAMARAGLNYVGVPCQGEERDGFVTGTYAGTGFMLIKRSAIEKMIAAYPGTKYKSIQAYPVPKDPSQNQYNLFDCMIDPERAYTSARTSRSAATGAISAARSGWIGIASSPMSARTNLQATRALSGNRFIAPNASMQNYPTWRLRRYPHFSPISKPNRHQLCLAETGAKPLRRGKLTR